MESGETLNSIIVGEDAIRMNTKENTSMRQTGNLATIFANFWYLYKNPCLE